MKLVQLKAKPHRVQILLMFNLSNKVDFSDCYAVSHKPGVATLIEPINGDPYVVEFAEDGETAKVVVFESLPGSGTDKMRCRLHAKQHYLSINPMRATA